jgi:Tol biopolymer transport system component
MELVEGDDLSQRLVRGAIPLAEALPLAKQITDALEAAHDQGVIHRDLKPANIRIRPDGTVKVLDFGLAKALDPAGGRPDASESPTITNPAMTQAGVILGTAAYMSPEQARGRPVDKRADIWAFGCVLFQMLTGRAVFARGTVTDTLAAVVDREPDWTSLHRSVPEQLRRLLRLCLEKDVRRRMRDIGDVRLALEEVDENLHSRAAAHRKTERPVRLGAAALVAVISLLSFVAGWWANPALQPAGSAQAGADSAVTLSPLTTDPGYEGEPTFAPDGETVAYVSDRTGNFEIFLRQASGGRDINLTNDSTDDVQPAFSPDGRQIAFVSSRGGGTPVQWLGADFPLLGGGVWIMPAFGGNPRRIAEDGNFPSWSPDGTSLLFTAGPWFGKKIYKVAAVGGTPEEIPVSLEPTQHWMYASYSPDARWICFEAAPADIYVVSASGGTPHVIARGHRPLWNADGTAIIYSSAEPGQNYSLWQVPVSASEGTVSGLPQPLTIGRGRDLPGSASRDGRRLAFTAQTQSFNLGVMGFDAEAGRETGKPEALTVGTQLIFFLSFGPDSGSLVFDSRQGASSHIWRFDRASGQQALTSDDAFDDRFPRWSPDGRAVVFNRRSSAGLAPNYDIWEIASDGGNPRLLVKDTVNGATAWMSDGRHLIYYKGGQLHRLDRTTAESVQLTNEPRVMPIMVVSPDDRWVVYQSTQAGNVDLRAVPTEGGPSRVVVATPADDYHPSFSPSGRWLYFQPSHKNLARTPGPAQAWREVKPETVTHFAESGLLLEDPQPSRDGRQLGFSLGRTTGDVWILNLRQ